ncbi:hypothetical protein EJB05_28772, partial [Eragrostis curvula]
MMPSYASVPESGRRADGGDLCRGERARVAEPGGPIGVRRHARRAPPQRRRGLCSDHGRTAPLGVHITSSPPQEGYADLKAKYAIC